MHSNYSIRVEKSEGAASNGSSTSGIRWRLLARDLFERFPPGLQRSDNFLTKTLVVSQNRRQSRHRLRCFLDHGEVFQTSSCSDQRFKQAVHGFNAGTHLLSGLADKLPARFWIVLAELKRSLMSRMREQPMGGARLDESYVQQCARRKQFTDAATGAAIRTTEFKNLFEHYASYGD